MRFCAVLRTHPKDTPGGAEYQAYLICRELARRGHDTHYVAHGAENSSVTEDEGTTVHRLAGPRSRRAVVRTLEEVDADVYYFRLATDLPLLWLAKRRIDATFVYNVSRTAQCRPLFAPGPTGESRNPALDAVERARFAVYRRLLQTPDEVFAQTQEQQALLHANHGIESPLIGNGHTVPELPVEKPSPPIILWLANLKSVKNPGAFLRLAVDLEDLECRFRMVGRPIDDDLLRAVRRAEREHERFDYLGGCDVEESNEHFERASVYVHTGNSEGFPNTFIQSWLRRTPVLSRCTDPDSILRDHDVGVHARSHAEAKNELERLIQDDEYRRRIGRCAREYAVANHSIDAVVDRIEERLAPIREERGR